MVSIRESGPDDLPTEVEINNAARPPDWQLTLEEARVWQSLRRPDEPKLFLMAIAGDRAMATGYTIQPHNLPSGRFTVDVAVRPELQRQGIGTELYARLARFAEANGARELHCRVHQRQVSRIEGWLERTGFRETERMIRSELDLSEFDYDSEPTEARLAADGITITTFAAEDTEANRRKLWKLGILAERDVPFDVPRPEPTFEDFQKMMDSLFAVSECLVIARHGDDYVGFTAPVRKSDTELATGMTGVHPDYRNRGLARAMKARCAHLARDLGYRSMVTANHTTNPAMLAVNRQLGYKPVCEVITFVKVVTATQGK